MNAGDLVCFADESILSRAIRWATRGEVSHVAAVYDEFHLVEPTGRNWGRIRKTLFGERLLEYQKAGGRVWLLRLGPEARARLQADHYRHFLDGAVGRRYDFAGAFWSAFPWVTNRKRFSRLFCSELYPAAMEMGCGLPPCNGSEARPVDLARLKVWASCEQICGRPVVISGFNSVEFGKWKRMIVADR